MRRNASAPGRRPENSTGPTERIAVEQGGDVSGTGRHRVPRRRTDAVVTRAGDRRAGSSTLARRLAPLAAGAAVMLIATTVATLAQPGADTSPVAQELSNSVAQAAPVTSVVPPPTTDPPAPGSAAPTTGPAQEAAAEPAPATRAAAAAPREEKDTADDTGDETTAAAPRSARAGGGGGGREAAAVHGWTRAGGDEFDGGMSPQWSPYDGEGHAGNGRRTPEAISVEDGALVIRGDSEGNTGGLSWKEDQRFGRWEMRARFPRGDDQYHPVLILWPDSGGSGNGEIDFAETTSASDKVSFFLHHGDDQEWAHKNVDITQWHNYAVEWVDGRVTGYLDGVEWFESTDESTLPPGKLHPTIQLDYFPEGDSPEPTEMHVDYLRIYR
jgi:hypothetical protein